MGFLLSKALSGNSDVLAQAGIGALSAARSRRMDIQHMDPTPQINQQQQVAPQPTGRNIAAIISLGGPGFLKKGPMPSNCYQLIQLAQPALRWAQYIKDLRSNFDIFEFFIIFEFLNLKTKVKPGAKYGIFHYFRITNKIDISLF